MPDWYQTELDHELQLAMIKIPSLHSGWNLW